MSISFYKIDSEKLQIGVAKLFTERRSVIRHKLNQFSTMKKETPNPVLEPFQANIKQVIRLLGKNQYTTNKVVVRELIQNAYDSIRERHGDRTPKDGSIVVTASSSPPTLTVTDNGAGMDETQLRTKLSVLGESLKKAQAQSGQPNSAIGEFGIGFFSSFMIADAITVVTRQRDSKYLSTWHSDGIEGFKIKTTIANKKEPEGTSVCLHLQSGCLDFSNSAYVEDVLQLYCECLDCPIHLHSENPQINGGTFPWELSSPAAQKKWCEKHFDSERVHFKTGMHKQGSTSFGYAFCYSNPDDATQNIHSKRMLVTKSLRFQPAGFEFTNILVNCDSLTLNLARENVFQNSTFAALEKGVETLLWDFLGTLFHLRGEDADLAACLDELQPQMHRRAQSDEKLLRKAAPYLLFPIAGTSNKMTIPEYLGKAKLPENEVLFAFRSKDENQPRGKEERLLLLTTEQKKIPVILVESVAEEELLRKVCVQLKARKTRLSDFSKVLLEVSGSNATSLESVRSTFERFLGRRVQIAKFLPISLPIMLREQEIVLNEDNKLLISFAQVTGLIKDTERLRNLYTSCFESWQALDVSDIDKKSLERLIHSINASLTNWGKDLASYIETERQLQHLTDRWWLGPGSIANLPIKRPPFEREGRKYTRRCFIACPFSAPFKDIIHTCGSICAQFGILAETAGELDIQDILVKICLKIDHCDLAIVDVTENNPNVMMELGLLFARRKPIIILRNRDLSQKLEIEVPADIKGIERIEYSNTSEELSSKLRAICGRITEAGHA